MQSAAFSEHLYLVCGTTSKLKNMQYSVWEEFDLYVFPVMMVIDLHIP
jgi:hypothetical protein